MKLKLQWRCRHKIVRCVHGDEIVTRGGARTACATCGKTLRLPLPRVCTVTLLPHQSLLLTEDDIDRQPFIRSDDARLRGSELSYEAAEKLLRYRQERSR